MKSPASVREMTPRVIILGALLSIMMGAANTYLGLRAGITVTASIPAAVVSMVLLRRVLGNGTILESNQVQTAASAGESLAAGIIFTLPALLIIGVWDQFNYWITTLIALAGGILGVLFMIPMRQVFILGGDSSLRFPEGVACAEVLRAGESVGAAAGARAILAGGLVGAAVKFMENTLSILVGKIAVATQAGGRLWYFGMEALPALIGVGFIIGLNVSANVFLGGAISTLIALPIMSGGVEVGDAGAVDAAGAFWSARIRYIGVGAMLVGGLLTIWQVRGGLVAAVRAIVKRVQSHDIPETERNLRPATIVLWSIIAILITFTIYLFLIGHTGLAILTTLIMVVASFFFTAVASYIVGLVGNSNSPVSGMTITSVLFAGLLILIFGFEGREGMLATLGVAAIVCCVACTAGDVCNDLKTGALVGATPYKQQIMQIVGVACAAFILAPVLQVLQDNTPGGIGGPQLPAPQAALFASLAEGFFGDGNLPWDLVGVGAGIGLGLAVLDAFLKSRRSSFRTYVMPVAVGMYLPLEMSTPIFLGGLVAWWVGRSSSRPTESLGRGLLFASGLIAGESLFGIALAMLAAAGFTGATPFLAPELRSLLTVIALAGVIFLLVRSSLAASREK